MGKIPFPPNPGVPMVFPILEKFVYGEDLTIEFADTCYFTASNQHTFMPILPTGSFVANTALGPYYAVPVDSCIFLTAFDEATRETYQYKITVVPPAPPSGTDEDPLE